MSAYQLLRNDVYRRLKSFVLPGKNRQSQTAESKTTCPEKSYKNQTFRKWNTSVLVPLDGEWQKLKKYLKIMIKKNTGIQTTRIGVYRVSVRLCCKTSQQ